MSKTYEKYTMPPGKYYIGDLCYVLHEAWDDYCDITIVNNQCVDGKFTLTDGRVIASFGTMYGDGTYYDQFGNEYGVDAGLIGCIKMSDINLTNPRNFVEGGAIRTYTEPFEVGYVKEGIIQFGDLIIDTVQAEKDYDSAWDDDNE